MACEYKEEIITFNNEEVKFSCDQFPAEKAVILKFKLINVFGSAIGELTSLATKDLNNDESITKIFELVAGVFDKHDPKKVFDLIKETVMGSRLNNETIQAHSINEKFSGDNMMLLYRLFIFIIKSNYSNFITTAKNLKAV